MFKEFTSLLPPEAWATIISALIIVAIGRWQWQRSYLLTRKSEVFKELSAEISNALKQVNAISSSTDSLLNELAKAADAVSGDFSNHTNEQKIAELDRRNKDLDKISDSLKKNLDIAYGGQEKILLLIKAIEKSTVAKKRTKRTARQLFYIATEQYQLIGTVNDVLISLRVTPTLGESPNISSDTFRALRELINLITRQNTIIGNYLEDLEVIMHNELVKGIFGKATFSKIPFKHLTQDGIIDTRSDNSLL